ncbi:hypothetical protein DPV73_11385 [Leptospira mayottensis]|nr:hypothetical protein DPV73_11385 [Leptospira mayottensis]
MWELLYFITNLLNDYNWFLLKVFKTGFKLKKNVISFYRVFRENSQSIRKGSQIAKVFRKNQNLIPEAA